MQRGGGWRGGYLERVTMLALGTFAREEVGEGFEIRFFVSVAVLGAVFWGAAIWERTLTFILVESLQKPPVKCRTDTRMNNLHRKV